LNGPTVVAGFRSQYDVARDGRQFLLNVPVSDQTAPQSITVVFNSLSHVFSLLLQYVSKRQKGAGRPGDYEHCPHAIAHP